MFLFRTIDPNMGGWEVYKLTIFTCSSVCHKRDIPLEGEEKDHTEDEGITEPHPPVY